MSIALARVGRVAAARVQTAHPACETMAAGAARTVSAAPLGRGVWTRSTRRHLSSDESIPQPGPLPGTIAAMRLVYDAHGQPLDVLRLEGYRVRAAPPRGNVLVAMLAAPINPADINQVGIRIACGLLVPCHLDALFSKLIWSVCIRCMLC